MKLSSIGDVLLATPVARAIRAAAPDSYIAWVVERKSADIVLGNPYLDEVFVLDRPKGRNFIENIDRSLRSLLPLGRRLRPLEFDYSLDLQGLLRAAMVSVLSGAKCRVGFYDARECSPLLYHVRHRPSPQDQTVQQRNLGMLRAIGIDSTDTAMHMPIGDEDREFAASFFKENGLESGNTVALIPATTWPNKHWITERWSEVADALADRYSVRSVVMGSKADLPMVNRIVECSRSKPAVSAGLTTLKQAGAILELCRVSIGVDTGLMHMSVALGRPTVGLFGASRWRCFDRTDRFVWVTKDFPCSPCNRHPTCSNVDCMRAITVNDVEETVRSWVE